MNKLKDEKLEEVCVNMKQREPYLVPLCGKALKLNNKVDSLPDFKANIGWLKNFKCYYST